MHMVLKVYSLQDWFYRKNIWVGAKFFWMVNRVVFACDIGIGAKIEKGVCFYHNGLGCVIHPKAVIGKGSSIYQNVTIGGNGKSEGKNGCPVVGENCFVGAGAVLVGPIVLGNDCVVAANSVVVDSVDPGSVVAGSPARRVR